MTYFDKVKNSNAWDPRFGLPLMPIHNNPWIYCAYTFLLLKLCGERRAYQEMRAALIAHLTACETEVYGLYSTWPGGSAHTSVDEVMGMAYLSPAAADRILTHLKDQDGIYDSGENNRGETMNLYRFIFLVPFLEACSGKRVSLWGQFKWAAHVAFHAFTHKTGNESDTLLIWLMCDVMEKHFLLRQVIWLWQKRMASQGIDGPRVIFSKYYLTECPVLGEIAVEKF